MKKKNLYKEKIILTNNNIEEIYQNIPKKTPNRVNI